MRERTQSEGTRIREEPQLRDLRHHTVQDLPLEGSEGHWYFIGPVPTWTLPLPSVILVTDTMSMLPAARAFHLALTVYAKRPEVHYQSAGRI